LQGNIFRANPFFPIATGFAVRPAKHDARNRFIYGTFFAFELEELELHFLGI
jgi:hypothetical protein